MLEKFFRNHNSKLPCRWFLFLLFSPIIAVSLGLLIKTGVEKCPIYVAIGFISFAAAFVLVWVCGIIYAIFSSFYLHNRYHYKFWKTRNSRSSTQETDDMKKLLFNDPKFIRMGSIYNKLGLAVFAIWFVLFLLTGVAILILKKMGIEIPLGS